MRANGTAAARLISWDVVIVMVGAACHERRLGADEPTEIDETALCQIRQRSDLAFKMARSMNCVKTPEAIDDAAVRDLYN
jgi:hypothetical protein